MDDKQSTQRIPLRDPEQRSWKRISVILVVCASILIGLYAFTDYQYRHQFSIVYNEVEKVRHDVIVPAGGVEWFGGTYTPYMAGNGLIGRLGCSIDVNCPTVSRTWLVPIVPGKQEGEFITKIFQTEGYRQENGGTGVKDGLLMLASIGSVSGKIKLPYPAPREKAWVLVQISVYLN